MRKEYGVVKKIAAILLVVVLSLAVAVPAFAADPPAKGGRPAAPTLGVIYVTSQELYYDTFVTVQELPWSIHNTNSFQPLANGETPFGPGDTGYRGGRWWIDSNTNGYQDAGDTYVLCPLLGPGRTSP
jgi:hypothetical protein